MPPRGYEHKRSRYRGLGEVPPPWGTHGPPNADAAREALAPYGYGKKPLDQFMEEKTRTQEAQNLGPLFNQREVQERTAYTSLHHPKDDAPYHSEDTYYTTNNQSIAAGASTNFTVTTVPKSMLTVFRCALATLVTAGAEADMRFSIAVGSRIVIRRAPLVVLADITCHGNIYVKAFEQKDVVLTLHNDGAGAHTVRFSLRGWTYVPSQVDDTSRGTIPATGR